MPDPVPDTEDSIKVCRQFCGSCPSFKPNKLNEIEPHALFCSRGKTDQHLSEIKDNGCFCFGCGIFEKYELEGGWFCIYGKEGKK
ncbi:MAG: DUF2769 domain-containing protein [Candidatus Lokiarchaeota archaeon]|nr:DUF2769 domain-containing protein [Candidatus Lokiarchaeota archaeon]